MLVVHAAVADDVPRSSGATEICQGADAKHAPLTNSVIEQYGDATIIPITYCKPVENSKWPGLVPVLTKQRYWASRSSTISCS